MWEILGEGMLGYVLLVDADAPRDPRRGARHPRRLPRMARVPFVVAAEPHRGARPGGRGRGCATRSSLDPHVPVVAVRRDGQGLGEGRPAGAALRRARRRRGRRASLGMTMGLRLRAPPAPARRAGTARVPGRRAGAAATRRRGRDSSAGGPGRLVDGAAAPHRSHRCVRTRAPVRSRPRPRRRRSDRGPRAAGDRSDEPVAGSVDAGLRRRSQRRRSTPTTRACARFRDGRRRAARDAARLSRRAPVRRGATADAPRCRTAQMTSARPRRTVERVHAGEDEREAAGRHPPRGRSGHAATS